MKVLYYTNIPAPYRVKFFNQLSKYVDLNIKNYTKNMVNEIKKTL